MREPHSKPLIRSDVFGTGWHVVFRCCDGWPLKMADTWREGMDAAFAHVREVHAPLSSPVKTPGNSAGRSLDALADADLEAAFHFDAMNRTHNGSRDE